MATNKTKKEVKLATTKYRVFMRNVSNITRIIEVTAADIHKVVDYVKNNRLDLQAAIGEQLKLNTAVLVEVIGSRGNPRKNTLDKGDKIV